MIFNESIYDAWKAFIQTGSLNHQVVRPEIAESWKRCKRMNVDPYGGVCNHILTGEGLEHLLKNNEELIRVSRPFLYNLYKFFKNSGFFVLLLDAEGYILDFFGDKIMEEEAANIHFMKGACWKEEYVGSTTMGVILHHREPLQMTGSEHYCKKSHNWTCSAAPIFDESEEMIGIVNVSGPCNEAHKHTLGMVVAAVEAIQHLLTIRKKNRELQVINERMINIFNTVSEAIIIVDSHKKIEMMNPVAEKILGKDFALGKPVNEIIQGSYSKRIILNELEFYDKESVLKTSTGKVECLITGVPIKDESHSDGMAIVIRPMDKIQKLVKRFGNHQARLDFSDIIGGSTKIKDIIQVASRASEIEGTVLLEGESGTGKEIFAQAIHNRSRRRKGPFVAVNCGAIPRELVGSELFGYVEGAFTGAFRGGRPGKFELASHGTIFLDEIGDMPLEQQVSLLRVLQERKVIRVGDNKEIPVDVRVICASNKNLFNEVERGNFRQDLYYRLNVISIKIPPLRERGEDIELLFRYFVNAMGEKSGCKIKEIDPLIFYYFSQYHWPGNVRELQNVAERMMSISNSPILSLKNVPEEICKGTNIKAKNTSITKGKIPDNVPVEEMRKKKKQLVEEKERTMIQELLMEYNGNISQVSKTLGVSRNTVYRKLRKYEIKI